jgi:hypothetical protein
MVVVARVSSRWEREPRNDVRQMGVEVVEIVMSKWRWRAKSCLEDHITLPAVLCATTTLRPAVVMLRLGGLRPATLLRLARMGPAAGTLRLARLTRLRPSMNGVSSRCGHWVPRLVGDRLHVARVVGRRTPVVVVLLLAGVLLLTSVLTGVLTTLPSTVVNGLCW